MSDSRSAVAEALKRAAPCTLDARFDIAPVTKLFSAVAAHHLLTHTSGIADDADELDGERFEDLFIHGPTFAPGAGRRYCNAGYILLGLMVEQDVAEGVEAIRDHDGEVTDWRRNVLSYPPIGDPGGGAYATVGDLTTFHRALVEGRLLGPEPTAAMLVPYA